MTPPVLIAITDAASTCFERWLVQLEALLQLAAPGRVMVMLRDRQLPVRERQALGVRLRELTRRYGQPLSVNDRLDLAVLLEADAVHLPDSGVSARDAREFGARFGRPWWISRACHRPQVTETDADALLLSPVAEPRKGRPALGAAGLARARAWRAASEGGPRLYALGGVTPSNAPGLLGAGADGVALIGALLEPGAPQALVQGLDLGRPGSAASFPSGGAQRDGR